MFFQKTSQCFRNWLRQKPPTKRLKKNRTQLGVESLEARLVPVVGAFRVPPPVEAGTGFDGVVAVDLDPLPDNPTTPVRENFRPCTGSLLFTGRHILTAAHCLTDAAGNISIPAIEILFEMPTGDISIPVTQDNYRIHPGWDPAKSPGNDIAIIELPELAPVGAERYHLNRNTNEVGNSFFVVGYGRAGQADVQADRDDDGILNSDLLPTGTKRMGTNIFDRIIQNGGSELQFDLDRNQRDWAAGRNDEVALGPGDSGSPSFLSGPTGLEIAGVNVRATPGSNFGSLGFATRVSQFADWIDETVAGYDLVVDMNSLEGSGGNDGRADFISVDHQKGSLVISLGGKQFHRDDLSNIRSIRILGSEDKDYITVDAEVGKSIHVDGRGGSDQLYVYAHSFFSPASNDTIDINVGAVTVTSPVHLPFFPLSLFKRQTRVGYFRTEKLFVHAGTGDDVINILGTAPTQTIVQAGNGSDRVIFGRPTSSFAINGDVYVRGGRDGGIDRLEINDVYSRLFVTRANYVISDKLVTANYESGFATPRAKTINISDFEQFALKLGPSDDTVSFQNTTFDVTSVDAGEGNNSISSPMADGVVRQSIFRDGQEVERREFLNGEEIRRFAFRDGRIVKSWELENGRIVRYHAYHISTGEKYLTREYGADGKETFRVYFKNGRVVRRWELENGRVVRYYAYHASNGEKYLSREYDQNGKETSRLYFHNGRVTRRWEFDDGRVVRYHAYHASNGEKYLTREHGPDGKIISQLYFRDGRIVKRWVYVDGRVVRYHAYHVSNGEKYLTREDGPDGKETSRLYFKNGRVVKRWEFENGRIIRYHAYHASNGEKYLTIVYEGERHVYHYFKNGVEVQRRIFVSGKEVERIDF